MKLLRIAALVVCAVSLTAYAAGIDGKWVSEAQVGDADGKTYPLTTTFTFKNEGGSLTGAIVQTSDASWMQGMNGKVMQISDGKVEGDKFTFKVKLDTKKGEKTAIYEGSVEGDQLKGVTKFRGIGMSRPFEAKRAD
jgi:hypothetical protein